MNAPRTANITHWEERVDLAAALRWAARLNLHEAVANHFSLAVNEAGTRFLVNPNRRQFSRVRASDLLEIDATDPATLDRPDAPDATAWGLHGALHRRVPHARCAMHVHSPFATVLACLDDPRLPPLDQNACMFYGRQAIDTQYGGLALEEEGERCAELLSDPSLTVLIMGNHGVMVIGETIAQAFDRLYYFERAAETYIRALQTGRPLRILSEVVAAKTAAELDVEPSGDAAHLAELKAILDAEGSDYAT
ncbi:MAG: class II aldolase/adducin family protein [Paracoccaceae bacterium]|jgi:ribulose-5-phosphate 4-epimerase/fuculose-1-phosphate aldolase|nr:class II aldolase/adducin family protein [Paracoccaceae bacterium]